MIKLLQSITLTQIVCSAIIVAILYIPVHYWIKGKKKDQEKAEKEKKLTPFQMDCMMSSEEVEDINSYS